MLGDVGGLISLPFGARKHDQTFSQVGHISSFLWFSPLGVGVDLLRLTARSAPPNGLCKCNQVFQRGPGSFHVSLGEGIPFGTKLFFGFPQGSSRVKDPSRVKGPF